LVDIVHSRWVWGGGGGSARLNNKNTYHCFYLRRWGQRDRLVLYATAPPQATAPH
jgi:hypothetical protein